MSLLSKSGRNFAEVEIKLDVVSERVSKRDTDVLFGVYISNLDWNGEDAEGEIWKSKHFT